ncbi:MAG: SGNH/GDSL hydrolase family protein [Oscillospiraceae bacterium]|nr:SGNH/GDSL hydrolase family protein [Oscillospiraceae bacterium]
MNLKGLKINFLGDSITQGGCSSKLSLCYVAQVAEISGAICRNYGIGGTRIAAQKVSSSCAYHDLDFCYRYSMMSKDADVVAVFGGTNDYGHGDAPVGSFEDRTPETFYGALHYLYSGLKEMYPKATIFVMLPLHREGEDNDMGEYSRKGKVYGDLKTYIKAICEVAEYHDLPVLDLYNESGMTADTEENSKKYFDDGLHPNDLGHRIIAEMVVDFLEKM